MLPVLRRVTIQNYMSIARCSVELGDLRFLVGPNGSGKSNFLDALRFVREALDTTLEQALRDRGGVGSVRRRSRGHPTHFGIRLDLALAEGRDASYAFKVGARPEGAFVVQREECRIHGLLQPDTFYVIEGGKVTSASCDIPAALEHDRLALVAVSGLPGFRSVYDVLRRMGFYSLSPDRIRNLQDPDPGQFLARDGRNLAAVVRELGRANGGRVLEGIVEHLRAVVPGVLSVQHKPIGPKETIEFRQESGAGGTPWPFLAASMSDGTLRALGILVAAFQVAAQRERAVSLVGIEEPEIALHPGAADVIAEALLLASRRVQMLITTHSPEILDNKGIRDDHILAVGWEDGETIVGPVDPPMRSALRDRLYSVGELLAQGQLEPDRESAGRAAQQATLFDSEPT